MALLTLGSVAFDDFEIPGQLRFGGAQQLAVHKLIGGLRIVDAMGRDDAAVEWSGVFAGTDAGDRARLLDAMRATGQQQILAWDEFSYSVVIERLDLEYRNPWWIPYRITCTVVLDQAQDVVSYVPDLAESVLNDLTSASAFVDVTGALAATAVPDALTAGNADYAAASIALIDVSNAVSLTIQTAQQNLVSTDLATLVGAAGSLASACIAQGYVQRSLNNLDAAGT